MQRWNAQVRRTIGLLVAVIVLGCVYYPSCVADDAPILKAGVTKRRVTPPEWVPYLTSSGNGTSAPFDGVHDDLHAAALVLDDGRQTIALLTVDSIGYDNAILGPDHNFTAELRSRVSAATAIKPAAIMLAASHTHSAPETIGLTPFRDEARVAMWVEKHLEDLAQTVIEAWRKRVPVRVRHGSTQVKDLSRHRRIALKGGTLNRRGPLPDPDQVTVPWQTDDELNVMYLETTTGKPHSVVLNFTAHPVVAMLLPPVSADYPGAAQAIVEAALPGVVCLFTQGACGNINSSKVTGTFDDVEQIGGELGRAALKVIARVKVEQTPFLSPAVAVSAEDCELAGRECPTLAEAQRAAEQKPSAANGQLLRLARKLAEGPIRAEVQLMRVGPIRWVALPGEPFVETGFALKRAGATFVVGYANGYVGYLPIRAAYAQGGYEATPGPWSRVAPGSTERLQEIGEKLLSQSNAAKAIGR